MKFVFSSLRMAAILALFMFAANMTVPAQDSICPISLLKLGRLDGRVVWKDTSAPFERTKVELFDIADEQILLETVQTGSNGEFRFRTARKGRFALKVHLSVEGKEVGPSYWVPVRIKRWNADDRRSILILRAYDCWDSDARVEKTVP